MPTIPSNDAWKRIQRTVLRVEQMASADIGTSRRRPVDVSMPIRAILLEDCPDETPTPAAVTVAIDTTEIQRLEIVGNPTGGVFRLGFRGEWTPELFPGISAASLEVALQGLPTLGRDQVSVPLGNDNFHTLGTWLIEFSGSLEGVDVPLLEIDDRIEGASVAINRTTIWADAGRIVEVRTGIPVGVPTPLRAGAVVLCLRHQGIAGWVIHAAEARQFSPYGYPPA